MTKLADIAKRLEDEQDEVMKRPSALQKNGNRQKKIRRWIPQKSLIKMMYISVSWELIQSPT
jgi:uncharacterized membrane protein